MKELQEVKRTAAKAAASLATRDAAIREAHEAGVALRKIAEAAGISHESVRRIASFPEPFATTSAERKLPPTA